MTRTKVADQRFSLKQWFAGGAESRGLRKPDCGHCYFPREAIAFRSAAMSNIYQVKTGSEFLTSSYIRPSTRFQILCRFKILHSGERIQKNADSHAGFAGLVWR